MISRLLYLPLFRIILFARVCVVVLVPYLCLSGSSAPLPYHTSCLSGLVFPLDCKCKKTLLVLLPYGIGYVFDIVNIITIPLPYHRQGCADGPVIGQQKRRK